jgi:parvulin-like peptidyl-prolyl isomerase
MLLVMAVPSLAQVAPPAVPAATAAPAARAGAADLTSLALGVDDVVVTVGDLQLRRSDIFRQLDLAAPARSAEVIRQMVLTTAAALDAQREGIDVAGDVLDKEVDSAIAEQKASFATEVDEKMPLEEYLRVRHGMSPEQHRAEVRRMVLASLLLERAVRLDQLRSGYEMVQLIVVEDEALAKDIAGQLAEGASFSVLAKRHSIHPSAARGGELPAMPLASDAPLLKGADALQPGGVLGPEMLALNGKTLWRIVRLADRAAPSAAPWAELREGIEAELAARPLEADELTVFEARVADRYRVSRPGRSP